MVIIGAVLGALGLVCLLYRNNFLGFLIGIQLMVLGATSTFVLAGAASGALSKGHVVGFFITLISVAQLLVGFALAVRLFYLKKRTDLTELRTLKH